MHALQDWPLEARRRITGVLTDIDDTLLTTVGAITPDAAAAPGTLKAAGLNVIATTGRPAGWSEAFALEWPVDAIVAESGAVAFLPYKKGVLRIPGGRKMLSKLYQKDEPTRASNFGRMQSVLRQIERELPGVHRSADSPWRETDIAIDYSEFAHLSQPQIAAVVALMKSEGMQATVRQHPHQRLVRRPQPAVGHALDRSRTAGPRAERRNGALRLRGRFDQRRAAVRGLCQLGRRRQSAAF